MHTLSNLSARSDQSMRVHHRAFIDIRADINEHRRHTDDISCDIDAIANRRSARHNANSIASSEGFCRKCIFIEKMKFLRNRTVFHDTNSEGQQDAAFDPQISFLTARCLFSSAELAALETRPEFLNDGDSVSAFFLRSQAQDPFDLVR